jgi:excisionase family DNA binding protein
MHHNSSELDNNTDIPAPKKGALTVAETAHELGITTKTLYLAINRGDIRAFRVGRVWRVSIEEISRIKQGATIRT